MASTRIPTPMRGVAGQLSRLSVRGISTSSPSRAAVSPVSSLTTSVDAPSLVVPLDQQRVTATIHHFPSLEPLRFEEYPANHLNLPTRRDILHRAIVFEGDAARSGTASTKWRSEVRGSARKMRPQKGSGRARLGDKKSPMLKGGGVAHGPKPRDFSTELQRKVYDLAWRTALSYRFKKGELIIVDNSLEIEAPLSSLVEYLFQKNQWGSGYGRSLLITKDHRPLLSRALAETPSEGMAFTCDQVDVKSLLESGRVVIERKALSQILGQHCSDVTSRSPSLSKIGYQRSKSTLYDVLGWRQFQKLESLSPEQAEELRPQIYEEAAMLRLKKAETLSPSERAQQESFAYELLAEANELQALAIEKTPGYNPIDATDAQRLEYLPKWIRVAELRAEVAEAQAEQYKRQSGEAAAAKVEEANEEADRYLNEVWNFQVELDQLNGVEVLDE